MIRLSRIRTFLIFAVLMAGMAAFVYHEKPPRGLYHLYQEHAGKPLIQIPTQRDFTYVFEAPGRNISRMWLQHLLADEKHEVRVTIENQTQGTKLYETLLVGRGHLHYAVFLPGNARGDRIAVTYHVEKSRLERWPTMAQAVKRAKFAPTTPVEVYVDGVRQDEAAEQLWPLVTLRFHQKIGALAWLWPVAGCVLAGLFAKNAGTSGRMLYLLLVGVALVGTSAVLWAQRYAHNSAFDDPDQYGMNGEKIAEWVAGDAEQRREVVTWWRKFDHTFVLLVPMFVALGKLLGSPMFASYVFLVGISSFGVLLLADWCLETRLRLSNRSILLALTLLATQFVFARAFVTASSDQPGVFLTFLACLALLARLARRFRWWEELLFALLLVALTFVRPPGLAYLAMFSGSAALMDVIRERRLDLAGQARAIALYALPAFAFVAVVFFGFDLFHNVMKAREFSKNYHHQSTFAHFWPTFLSTAHVLLVFGVFLRPGDFRDPTVRLMLGWCAVFLLLLTVVRAPFLLRLFLPLVPAIYVIVAPGIERATKNWPWLAFGLTAIVAGANVWLLLVMRYSWPGVNEHLHRFTHL